MDSSTIVAGTATAGGSLSQQHSLTYLSSTLQNASFSTYIRSDHDQVEDSELSIFDAKKYFNDCTNEETNTTNKQVDHHHVIYLQPRLSSASSVDGYGRNNRACSFNATPTASSEASWNSQTGLLSNPPGAIAVSMRNPDDHEKKKSGCGGKWLFGRKCPCSGEKSVQVEEKLSEPKTPHHPHLYNKKQPQNYVQEKSNWIPNSHRISTTENGFSSLGQRVLAASGRPYTTTDHGTTTTTTTSTSSTTTAFSFPVLNQTSPIKLRLNAPPEVDPPRESLEIFQPSDSSTKTSLDQLQHRMLLTRQSLAFPASPKLTDDDVASDASSDLFEIESFSTQTTTTAYPMYHRRDSLDEASSFNARRLGGGGLYCGRSMEEVIITPSTACTECYEPSEASIDWSVTTAEGFDRGSATNFSSVTAQEIDEMMGHHHEKKNNNNNASGVGGVRPSSSKKGNGSLLLSCRCEKAVSVGPNPVKCVPAESATTHVNCRSSKPPLARSHSSRLSIPFAT